MPPADADGVWFPAQGPDAASSNDARDVVVMNESGLSLPLSVADIEALCLLVMRGENVGSFHIEVLYVDEPEISRIHLDFLGSDEVTDNIAFSYGSGSLLEGSIAQCAQRIMEQAGDLGVEPRLEFARILIHGLLHLAGHDDATPADRNRMSQDEDRYLAMAGYSLPKSGMPGASQG